MILVGQPSALKIYLEVNMALFGGKAMKHRDDLEQLSSLMANVVYGYTSIIETNIKKIAQRKYSKKVELKGIGDSQVSDLLAYSVIAVGSYFNGKKIFLGNDWQESILIVKNEILIHGRMHLSKEMLEELINQFNKYEKSRIEQASQVIKAFINRNLVNSEIDDYEIKNISDEIVPLIEYMCMYFIIYIDSKMNRKDLEMQLNLKKKYLVELTQKFEINTNSLDIWLNVYL
jgi:hypothetical protein